MTSERCKHDLPVDQCGDCRPAPPGLTNRVVVTRGGQVFHRTADCPALQEGQRYAERRADEVHQPIAVSLSEAQSDGRAACAVCFPGYRPHQAPAASGRHGQQDREPGTPQQAAQAQRDDPLEELATALDAARRSVAAAITADVNRHQLTDIVSRALLDIREQVWPDAAPAQLPAKAREEASRARPQTDR